MAGEEQRTIGALHGRALQLTSAGELDAAGLAYEEVLSRLEVDPGPNRLLRIAVFRDMGSLSLRLAMRTAAEQPGSRSLVDAFLDDADRSIASSKALSMNANSADDIRPSNIQNERAATQMWEGRSDVVRWYLTHQFGRWVRATDSIDEPTYRDVQRKFANSLSTLRFLGLRANPYYRASLGMNAARWSMLYGDEKEARQWRRYAIRSVGLAAVKLDGRNLAHSLATIKRRWGSATDRSVAFGSLNPFDAQTGRYRPDVAV
ncbi:MAG TPA: hypothetical protein VGS28_02230 [Candidatus Saccharimonadales bacterium]|nr:hypothetical protein [Candidatus Saccharimonadales bacterium]